MFYITGPLSSPSVESLQAPERPYHNVFTSDWCHKRSIIKDADTCADPLIFAGGGGGGGGGGGRCSDKKSDAFFFSTQLILQKPNGYFQKKLSFSEVPDSRGIGRGLLIPYRNPYNL